MTTVFFRAEYCDGLHSWGNTSYKLQVTKLQVTSYKLQVTSYQRSYDEDGWLYGPTFYYIQRIATQN